jgi:hypothetical protein
MKGEYVSSMHEHRPRVPDAVRHSSCRSAEPGSTLTFLSCNMGPGSAAHHAAKRRRAALRPGHKALAAVQRGGHPLCNIALSEKPERRALKPGRLALALRNGDQKVATS